MATNASARRAITTAVDLDKLAGWRGASLYPEPIRLEIPELTGDEAIDWQVILNRQSEACGCKEGLLLALIFATSYIGYLLVHHSTLRSWSTAGLGMALFAVGAVVGKAIALVEANAQRIQTLRRIRSALHTRSSARTKAPAISKSPVNGPGHPPGGLGV
jgi:hypothetical protein